MRVQIGHKFILGFLIVVAVVAFTPEGIRLLGYSAEISNLISYLCILIKNHYGSKSYFESC